jgi:hypothetical protein
VSLEERFYVLPWDQTHIVTQGRKLAPDKMGARTGFRPDQAARNIAEAACKLMTGYFLLQNDHSPLVEPNQMECVLADVETSSTPSTSLTILDGWGALTRLAARWECLQLADFVAKV